MSNLNSEQTSEAIFIDGKSSEKISFKSRAIHYGDGLFETILIKNTKPILLEDHLQRLALGCSVLGYKQGFDEQLIRQEITNLAHKTPNCIIKLILSRNQNQRGYALSKNTSLELYFYSFPAPEKNNNLKLMLCQTKLAKQPSLAKIKHLNRLEQVLASNELKQGFDEGIMFLQDTNELIETISNNVFLVKNNQISTPLLKNAGVEGVAKKKITAIAKKNNIKISEKSLNKNDLITADAVFITNSIYGIRTVEYIDSNKYKTNLEIVNTLIKQSKKYFTE